MNNDLTIKEVLDGMNEDCRNRLYYCIGLIIYSDCMSKKIQDCIDIIIGSLLSGSDEWKVAMKSCQESIKYLHGGNSHYDN